MQRAVFEARGMRPNSKTTSSRITDGYIVPTLPLAEHWQDELPHRFSLQFEIFTIEKEEVSRTGSWFQETSLDNARLDRLSSPYEALT